MGVAGTSSDNSMPHRGRKSTTTQNAMWVTDLDLCFTYVCTSWEGSVHDSRIFFFTECINDFEIRFPTLAEGVITIKIMCFLYATKYSYTISKFVGYFYLVDSGYGC